MKTVFKWSSVAISIAVICGSLCGLVGTFAWGDTSLQVWPTLIPLLLCALLATAISGALIGVGALKNKVALVVIGSILLVAGVAAMLIARSENVEYIRTIARSSATQVFPIRPQHLWPGLF